MKVFISWSGQRSKEVAELLSDWVKCVLQASKPWISTRDIDKGAIWFTEISDQLKDTAAGIVCLTQDNKDKPWILFETGALAKGLSTNRVCTFLIDLKPSEIEDPLAQFNHTMPDESSLWGLTCSLNSCLGTERLDERILRKVFDTYWPQFHEAFSAIIERTPVTPKQKARSDKSILDEILDNTRVLSARVRDLEGRSRMTQPLVLPPDSPYAPNIDKVFRISKHHMEAFDMAVSLFKKGWSKEDVLKEVARLTGFDDDRASMVVERAAAVIGLANG